MWEKNVRGPYSKLCTFFFAGTVHCCVFYMVHLVVNWLVENPFASASTAVQHTILCLCSKADVSSLCRYDKPRASDSSGFFPE